MEAHAISTGYITGKVYIIWDIPHDKITDYEILRDGKPLTILQEEFVSPTLFDADHHTNLFVKPSTHQLMYIDETVNKYQHYEYQVVAKRLDNDTVVEEIKSNPMYIQAQ
jgi:hypothetical protein